MPKNVYERLEKRYQEKRRAAEGGLSQLEVDYDDSLDFLDKCILVASMLLYLHQRFNYDQRKDLLKAVFEKIYVRDKEIVDVKLNPPFRFSSEETWKTCSKIILPGAPKRTSLNRWSDSPCRRNIQRWKAY